MGILLSIFRNQQLQLPQQQQQQQLPRAPQRSLQQQQQQRTFACEKSCIDVLNLQKFTIHIFQSKSSVVGHTGAILEYQDAANYIVKFDFGYGCKSARLSGSKKYPNSKKYNHLVYRQICGYTIEDYIIVNPDKIQIIYSISYFYARNDQFYPFLVMFDESNYSLHKNNCRHYITKLIHRLSYGRNKHQWELDIINDIVSMKLKTIRPECKYHSQLCPNH